MYSNISEAYSYNLWTTFGTTEAQTLMKRAKLSVKAILIFNQTAGAKKKKNPHLSRGSMSRFFYAYSFLWYFAESQ